MSKLPLHFINVGLPPNHPSIPAHLHAQVAAGCDALQASYDRCNAHLSLFYTTPDTVDEFVAYMKQHGSQLDGVVIGFGVRGNPELTPFFEQLVDAVRVYAPKARLIFNSSPTNSLQGIQRYFPQIQEQRKE